MTDNVETEFKLRTPHPIEVAVVDAAVRESAFECASAQSRRHNDIYLDDARHSLAEHGIGLRVRIDDGRSTVTCKSKGRREGAMFVREEYEAPWPSPTTPPTAAELPAALRDAIEPIVLRRPLVPVLRLDINRDTRRLTYDKRELCELAIDRVTAHGLGRSVQFTEIELEVADDLPSCEKLAEHLERVLDVQAAGNDKPTHAARLLGLASQNGTPTIGFSTAASIALDAVLRRQIARVQRAEIRVRQSHEAERVHAMRTALRRLRSIVSAFRHYWPESESRWVRAHLRALAAELGRVRDLDVMVAGMPKRISKLHPDLQQGAERVFEWLRSACRQQHQGLAAWLRSSQRLDDAQRFANLLFEFVSKSDGAEPTIAEATAECLDQHRARLHRRTKALTEHSPMPEFHQARIAGKRLRYLVEELADFAPPLPAKTAKRLTKLQDAIGLLCDQDNAMQQLLGWAPQILAECGDDALVGPALGALVQAHFAAAAQRRPKAMVCIEHERQRLRLSS